MKNAFDHIDTDEGPPLNLVPFFDAKSLVVVGASSDATKQSGRPLYFLSRYGYTGDVFAVNPAHEELFGFPSYESIESLPVAAELALIMLPAEKVVEVVRACGERGTKAAVVFGNGFADVGNHSLQNELRATARATGVRLLGPNCLGALNTSNGLTATFSAYLMRDMFRSGPVGLVTQSGSLGNAILLNFQSLGVGISKWVATGNEADLDLLNFVDYMVSDDRCKVLVVYAEAVKDAWRWAGIAEKAFKLRKPIIVLKAGVGARSSRAVVSHSGKLTGSHRVWEDFARLEGLTVVNTLEELCDAAHAFSLLPLQRGSLAMLGTGGAGVLAMDECHRQSMPVANLLAETKKKLSKNLPRGATVENPIDPTPTTDSAWQLACETTVKDPSVGYFMVVISSLVRPHSNSVELLEPVLKYARTARKAVGITYLASADPLSAEHEELLRSRGALILPTANRVVQAFAHLRRYSTFVPDAGSESRDSRVDTEPLSTQAETLGLLDLAPLLRRHGISVVQTIVVRNVEEAAESLKTLGAPTVFKLEDPCYPHKSEHGLVRVGISDAENAALTFNDLIQRAKSDDARVVVQPQIGPGVELLVACIRDQELGPVITVGAGGVLTELMRDSYSSLAPVSSEQAIELLRHTRVYRILAGYRNSRRADVFALGHLISAVSKVFVEQQHLIELELNPVIVLNEEPRTLVVDLLAVEESSH